MFEPQERVVLFVDGANLAATSRALQFNIDFRQLLALFQRKSLLVRALYYTAISEDSSIQPLVDWLDYNGYSVVTKAAKEYVDASGQNRIKGNMNVELAVDAMQIAPCIDHIVLFSGNGEFSSLVTALQRIGKRVSVVSTLQTEFAMVSDDLRRVADQFIDLADLESELTRDREETKA